MRQPTHTTDHPAGGKFHWFALGNGTFASVLDDDYLGDIETDFEIHERTEAGDVIQHTERHAPDWAGVHLILDELEAR